MTNNFKEKTKYIISCLDGYHQLCKMFHWSAKNNHEHELTDEIDGSILSYQDKIAEDCMGTLGIRFGLGDLSAQLSQSKSVKDMLDELEKDVIEYKECIGDNKNLSSMDSITDAFLEDIHRWKYLSTFN